VTLLSGPTSLAAAGGRPVHAFETAADLHGLLVREFPECDGLAMAAASPTSFPRNPSACTARTGTGRLRLRAGRTSSRA
jgi:hypothetical protein